MSERQGHASRMLPLVALVRRQVAASGLPLREFARERGIKYGTLQRYHNKKLEPLLQGLKPDTLKDLAAALDVPLSEVERAADASVGRRYKQNVGPNISIYVASGTPRAAFLLGQPDATRRNLTMHVASRDIAAPVALIEHTYTVDGRDKCTRILVFREGLLAQPIISLLAHLLRHI